MKIFILNLLNQKLSDLELIAINISAEYLSIDSEYRYLDIFQIQN